MGEDKSLLLIEHDYFMRTSLRDYLQAQGYRILEAQHAEEALTITRRERPSVAILNVALPVDESQAHTKPHQNGGLQLTRRLKELDPRMGIVLFSAFKDKGADVLGMLHFMRGLVYLVKRFSQPEQMEDAIRMAERGDVWIDPAVDLTEQQTLSDLVLNLCLPDERRAIERALQVLDRLTSTEIDVLREVGAAMNTKGIARNLSIAPGTVESHINHIYGKLFSDAVGDGLRRSVLLAKVALIWQIRESEE